MQNRSVPAVLAAALLTTASPLAAARTVIASDDPAILYSPGNWSVTASGAATLNAGAYFSTLFTGSSLAIGFSTSANLAPLPQLYFRIDGYSAQSPWTRAELAPSIVPAMPSDTAALPYHLLEVVVKSTSEALPRWSSPGATTVVFSGLTLARGATAAAPAGLPTRALFFGDSITEGVRTVNDTAAHDTDRNDATMGWAYAQRGLLGVEAGIIGFGGTGLTVTGSGGVPALPATLGRILPDVARQRDPGISLVVLNEGTNDVHAAASAVAEALAHSLDGLLALYPAARIAVLRPFSGMQGDALVAGIARCAEPARVAFIDTAGMLDPAFGVDSTTLHPSGPNSLGRIAPRVAARLAALLRSPLAAPAARPRRRPD